MNPSKDTILACGSKVNTAKLISVTSGEVLCDFAETHPFLTESPVVACDSSPIGRYALIAQASGQVHIKNILVTGATGGTSLT